jgi:hypothetical protein
MDCGLCSDRARGSETPLIAGQAEACPASGVSTFRAVGLGKMVAQLGFPANLLRWDERAGLRRDCVKLSVSALDEVQDKETDYEEEYQQASDGGTGSHRQSEEAEHEGTAETSGGREADDRVRPRGPAHALLRFGRGGRSPGRR